MRALTIRQPWASLIACGAKTIETRSWLTKYRGPLLIHAGKQWAKGWSYRSLWHDPDVDSDARWRSNLLTETLGCEPTEDVYGSGYWTADHRWSSLPLGAVVAVAELLDVVPITDSAVDGTPTVSLVDTPLPGGGSKELLWKDDGRQCWPIQDQLPLGDFTPGGYAWLLDNVSALPGPIPAKGRQGLWTPDDDLAAAAREWIAP